MKSYIEIDKFQKSFSLIKALRSKQLIIIIIT